MDRICFAIPVHEHKPIIRDVLENIRYFCPNSEIVLYQSGENSHLCEGLRCLVCPTSRNLEPSGTTLVTYHLEIMKWLHEMQFSYDFLVYIDSDILFARKGFEEFICSEMATVDYMAAHLKIPADEQRWFPAQTMAREWEKWKSIFESDNFLGCFNNGQVFSKSFVQKIVSYNKLTEIEKNLRETSTFAIEEILFVTLARTLGLRIKSYPEDVQETIRWRPYFDKHEVENYVTNHPRCFLFHPVHRVMDDEARKYIRSLVSQGMNSSG